MKDKCFCNVKSKPHCCVIDCAEQGAASDCYRCHCAKDEERCIMTGETKQERRGNKG